MPQSPLSARTRRGAAAGLLGVAAALTAVTGAGPVPSIFQLTGATEDVSGPCDEAEHATDAACAGVLPAGDDGSTTSSTVDEGTTSTSALGADAPSEIRTVSAGEAGSIMVAVEGTSLRLLAASPNAGWQAEVEHAAGPEVEVTFRSGNLRVDVQIELEDGQVRERVRTRDLATGTETRVENGVVVRDDGDDLDDDHSGSDSDDHGDDSDDDADEIDDDHSDDSSGSDEDSDDDSDEGDHSGSGSDDGPDHD